MKLRLGGPALAGGALSLALLGAIALRGTPDSSLLQRSVDSTRGGLPKGALAPDFQLTSIYGKTIGRSDLEGSSAVLIFVTPTCPFCTTLKEALLANSLPDLRGSLVFVSSNRGAPENVSAEILDLEARLSAQFPVVQDSTGSVFEAFGIRGVPTTVLLDEKSRVEAVVTGPDGLDAVHGFVQKSFELQRRSAVESFLHTP